MANSHEHVKERYDRFMDALTKLGMTSAMIEQMKADTVNLSEIQLKDKKAFFLSKKTIFPL